MNKQIKVDVELALQASVLNALPQLPLLIKNCKQRELKLTPLITSHKKF